MNQVENQHKKMWIGFVFIGLAMIASWILPVSGILFVDGTAIKITCGVLLLLNIFVGGSAKGAETMAHEGTIGASGWMGWEAANVIAKIVITVICLIMFIVPDKGEPIKDIHNEGALQGIYMREKAAYEAERRSLSQTIIYSASAKDSPSEKMWKDAVKERKKLDRSWQARCRDIEATRESFR